MKLSTLQKEVSRSVCCLRLILRKKRMMALIGIIWDIYYGGWGNIWCIKYILRGFELISGLQVNFHKSKVYGIHASQYFLQEALTFLSCNVGLLPFKFLGMPIGANPRRCHRRWRIVIYVGWRVTLLNATLNSIPLYFLSFFVSPKITQEIVKIQRNFLWGGVKEERKKNFIHKMGQCMQKKGR